MRRDRPAYPPGKALRHHAQAELVERRSLGGVPVEERFGMTNVVSPARNGASQPRHASVAEPVELLHGVGEVPVPFHRLGRRLLVFLLESFETLLRFLERRGSLVRLLLQLREPPVLRRHALLERGGRRLALLDLPAKRGGLAFPFRQSLPCSRSNLLGLRKTSGLLLDALVRQGYLLV